MSGRSVKVRSSHDALQRPSVKALARLDDVLAARLEIHVQLVGQVAGRILVEGVERLGHEGAPVGLGQGAPVVVVHGGQGRGDGVELGALHSGVNPFREHAVDAEPGELQPGAVDLHVAIGAPALQHAPEQVLGEERNGRHPHLAHHAHRLFLGGHLEHPGRARQPGEVEDGAVV